MRAEEVRATWAGVAVQFPLKDSPSGSGLFIVQMAPYDTQLTVNHDLRYDVYDFGEPTRYRHQPSHVEIILRGTIVDRGHWSRWDPDRNPPAGQLGHRQVLPGAGPHRPIGR